MSSITAKVGSYGTVKGFTSGNVAEFRGLPYARIPARFRRAELVKSVSGEFDATKYGPYPPQTADEKGMEFAFWGEFIKTHWAEEEGRTMSEENCLNLNIVTPQNAIGNKKLPVMVWLYGNFSESFTK
jgi:carboxylesterase type B